MDAAHLHARTQGGAALQTWRLGTLQLPASGNTPAEACLQLLRRDELPLNQSAVLPFFGAMRFVRYGEEPPAYPGGGVRQPPRRTAGDQSTAVLATPGPPLDASDILPHNNGHADSGAPRGTCPLSTSYPAPKQREVENQR